MDIRPPDYGIQTIVIYITKQIPLLTLSGPFCLAIQKNELPEFLALYAKQKPVVQKFSCR